MQLRILYSYSMKNGEPTFLIADYFIKKKNKKDYIKKFDCANSWSVDSIFKLSYLASAC